MSNNYLGVRMRIRDSSTGFGQRDNGQVMDNNEVKPETAEPQNAEKGSFPVLASVRLAYLNIFPSSKALALPLAFLVLVFAMAGYLSDGMEASQTFLTVAAMISSLVLVSLIAMVSQAVLMGFPVPLNPLRVMFSRAFLKHSWAMLIILFCAYLAGVTAFHAVGKGLGSITGADLSVVTPETASFVFFAFIAGFYTAVYVGIRLFVILPGVVSGGKISFRNSWRATRGSAFRIWFAAVLATMPFSALTSGLTIVMGNSQELLPLVALAVLTFVSMIIQIMVVSGLSAAAHTRLAPLSPST